jgi:hypothetical protein
MAGINKIDLSKKAYQHAQLAVLETLKDVQSVSNYRIVLKVRRKQTRVNNLHASFLIELCFDFIS